MAGRNRTLLVLALLLAVALAGCGARGEPATVEAPTWHAGYTWSHDGTARYVFEEAFGDERENGTGSADFVRTERVVNTGLDADGEPVYLTVQRFDAEPGADEVGIPTSPVLSAYRQSDLKPVDVEGMRRESCSSRGPCSVALEGVALDDERPEDVWLPFPLRTGDTWGGTYELYGGDIQMRYTAEAGRMRTVETPLGKVDALRIDVRHRPVDLDGAIREFEEEAREEGYMVEDLRIDVRRDQVMYYSPAYQTVVSGVNTGQDLFSASFPDGEGGRVEARSESRYEERFVLSGARLVAGPELALEEIADLLRPDADLGDVAGVPVPEATYKVAVAVLDGEVNAFEQEAGRFEARVEGAETPPEGHELRWSLLRGDRVVATATGQVFEPAPEDPGRYAVVLEALDAEGTVVASAGGGLVAHYEGRVDLSCDVVRVDLGPFGVGVCDEVPVPVHPGVRSVRVVATASGPPNPTAEFVVEDAIGRPVPVREEGDRFVVDLESFDGTNVGAEPWSATWDALAGVLEGIVLDVRVDYGEAPASSVAEPEPDDAGPVSWGQGRLGHRPAWLP